MITTRIKAAWNAFFHLPGYNGVDNGDQYRSSPYVTKETTPEKLSTVFNCQKILAETLAKLPLLLTPPDNSKEETKHSLHPLLRIRPNGYQTLFSFISTLEFNRNKAGNAYAWIKRDHLFKEQEFIIITPSRVEAIILIDTDVVEELDNEGTKLFYKILPKSDPNDVAVPDLIPGDDMLHFKGVTQDGIVGISPLKAAYDATSRYARTDAIIERSDNNKVDSPLVLESDVNAKPTKSVLGKDKSLMDWLKDFTATQAGWRNAGKPITLPPGVTAKRLDPQNYQEQNLEVLKFSRGEIAGIFGVPPFMLGDLSAPREIEDLSRLFKNQTMSAISKMYKDEFECKLLTDQEILSGWTIEFDIDKMIEVSTNTLVESLKKQVTNGMMSPDYAAKVLGLPRIEEDWGQCHFIQGQYVPIEYYEKYAKKRNNENTKSRNPDAK